MHPYSKKHKRWHSHSYLFYYVLKWFFSSLGFREDGLVVNNIYSSFNKASKAITLLYPFKTTSMGQACEVFDSCRHHNFY
jgi:hypothetical protein